MNMNFSILTAVLMLLGWATHWLVAVRKARKVAEKQSLPRPSLWSYWTKDPYAVALSIVGLIVGYLIIPTVAQSWPELAKVIGATAENPMNPLAAYLGGIVAPWIADLAGRRIGGMIGGASDEADA